MDVQNHKRTFSHEHVRLRIAGPHVSVPTEEISGFSKIFTLFRAGPVCCGIQSCQQVLPAVPLKSSPSNRCPPPLTPPCSNLKVLLSGPFQNPACFSSCPSSKLFKCEIDHIFHLLFKNCPKTSCHTKNKVQTPYYSQQDWARPAPALCPCPLPPAPALTSPLLLSPSSLSNIILIVPGR